MCYNFLNQAEQMKQVTVKGIRDGLLIVLEEGATWEERLSQLTERLKSGATFFHGGRAALDVGSRAMSTSQVQQARDLLAHFGVELWALLGTSDDTIVAAVRAGLSPTLEPEARAPAPLTRAETKSAPPGGLVVMRNVRSGQRLEHPGDIIIIGNVHAGAEVIAGRHVVVWGRLEGMVHAGAMGDESAVVCALRLTPTQLRIAGYITRSPEKRPRSAAPEMAQIVGRRIEAVEWHGR